MIFLLNWVSFTTWWFFSPTHVENMLVKLDHFPRDRGENKKKVSNHHLVYQNNGRRCERRLELENGHLLGGWAEKVDGSVVRITVIYKPWKGRLEGVPQPNP